MGAPFWKGAKAFTQKHALNSLWDLVNFRSCLLLHVWVAPFEMGAKACTTNHVPGLLLPGFSYFDNFTFRLGHLGGGPSIQVSALMLPKKHTQGPTTHFPM